MKGLDFALTALFVVLLVEQIKASKSPIPFMVATVCIVGAFFAFGGKNLLLISLGATLLGLMMFRKRIKPNAVQ